MAEGEERPSGGDEGDDENGKYPIGFRFKPTTEELVEFYLLPKLLGEPTVPNEFVIEAKAYECDPEILTEKYKESGVDDDTWHFLSPRNRKYPGGDRPVRRTADDRGRWKPSTGQSKPQEEEEDASTSHPKAAKKAAFSENTLAYFVGPTKDEAKTKWLMHELVVPETPDNGFHGKRPAGAAEPRNDKLLNRFVVCRIYKSPLRKWKEKEIEEEEEEAAAAEVPTSSQGPAPDQCVGEAAERAPSSSRQPPAKRPAVERPSTSGAPNRGVSVSQTTTLFPSGGRSAPARGNGGGSSVRMPAVGAGAAEHRGPAGLVPALIHRPRPVYNSMQGPVQMQRPPLIYRRGSTRAAGTSSNANDQQAAPGQGPPPVLRLRPSHHAAATTVPKFQGPKMMTRPPNLAAGGQQARLPSPRQQQPPPPETEEAYRNRVYATLIAEMKLQRAREGSAAARAGQQQISPTASVKPVCFHCVPPAQFPAPHGAHPYSSSSNLAQRPQRQQSSSASATHAAAEDVASKQSVPPPPGACANEGNGKGGAATIADNYFADLAAGWPQ